jgi:hypothetical protein
VKCVRCGTDSKYKDRAKGRCPSCGQAFAFEPQKGDVLTDAAFQSAIDAVSGGGRVRWGVEHLYYEVCRRRRRLGAPPWAVVAVVVVAFVLGLQSGRILLGFVAAAVAGIGFAWLLRKRRATTVRLELERFNTMWARWQKTHGTPKGLIVRRSAPATRRAPEPDLADYSFDRAVVCDRARTVDLLVANNFHFENNCAVLSVGGYPPGPFETIRAMLRRNPRLQVFALHDASVAGCRLAHQLATSPEWFAHLPTVTDVGLRPEHARPLRGLYLASAGSGVGAGQGLSAADARWLAAYTLELAAIRPEQVLKRLFRAINRTRDADDESDRDEETGAGSTGSRAQVEQDTAAFATDAGDSDGGADAFG